MLVRASFNVSSTYHTDQAVDPSEAKTDPTFELGEKFKGIDTMSSRAGKEKLVQVTPGETSQSKYGQVRVPLPTIVEL